MKTSTTRSGFSPDKKNKEEINFNPEGPLTSDEVLKLQEELNRTRAESKQLKQRLNKEVE